MAHREPPIRLFGGRGTRRRFCIRVAKRVVANRTSSHPEGGRYWRNCSVKP